MIIAIDGPAGAGKSTIARMIAQRLGFLYIDTGAMYRALTLKLLKERIDLNDSARIISAARSAAIDLGNDTCGSLVVMLDGEDVSLKIRQPQVSKYVSDIAQLKEVRQAMLKLQRKLGRSAQSVLDGRDIGTIVFPDADKKFYLDADFQERVRRRYKELKESGLQITEQAVEEDLSNRDRIDSTRKVAPLKQAEDAVYIDTTNMTIEQVLEEVLRKIKDTPGIGL